MPKLWAVQGLLQLLLTSIALCSPVTTVDPSRTLERRQSEEGLVSGIAWRDEHGNVPVRREIRDLQANHPEQWSLYLLGLSTLQWVDQNETRSYYRLAGIHGRPYQTWGNAPGLKDKIGKVGYCPHSNILFMGWHRPYLALFEEELYKKVKSYAAEATGESAARWINAANSFRMPYWDWARGGDSSVPESFMMERIDVTRPASGQLQNIWNPLYAYYFHPLVPEDFESKWTHLNATQRWPTSDASNSTSDQTEMVKTYAGQRRGLHDTIDTAFRHDTINKFATTVEQAHGWVHGVIGGGWDAASSKKFKGHMWPLEYSAFEPLFMLHHTNVDRLFAMYQAAHPDIYFTSESIGSNGNVFLADDAVVDANTELLPFRKPSKGFWTTNDARNTTTLGYAYPETIRVGSVSEKDHATAVQASIAQLYGSSVRDMLQAQPATAGRHAVLSEDGVFTDWAIETRALAHGLPPSFVVRFLLTGDRTVDVGSWVKLTHSAHGSKMRKKKRASAIEQTYNGSVSLTASLIDEVEAGKLRSLEAKDVVPFLNDKLTWKALASDGTHIPQSQLGAFSFEVVSSAAHIPVDPKSAIEYSKDVDRHPEVMVNKAGRVAT